MSINNRKLLIETIKSINSNSCPNNVNFHIHSTFSDGSLTPKQIYNQALEFNIKNFAVTDHHNIKAFLEIEKLLLQNKNDLSFYQPNFWSGIEITCLLKGCLVHVIGLGFDPQSTYMNDYKLNQSTIGKNLLASSVVNCIHKANGLAFLAHPARYKIQFNTLIDEASSQNFDGVETWYDYERSSQWTPTDFICERILNQANSLNLLSTCGTDTHGLSIKRR